ncbi:pyridoxal phosphate-dependent decarboxylase family protein [Marinibacterium sp. SX1]|uniref:pyridoxal phosphate-dependent decarboxylase family protein n=1 Tax=Marinibacterium sp. SX1 TaxID=3388424 RepID=UPI003D177F06
MTDEGHHLDPTDWDDFSEQMHGLLDACLARMEATRSLPWRPVPDDFADSVALDGAPQALDAVFARMTGPIMAQATGNTHPRFWGWVHGSGLPVSVGAELVAATMNANTGGRWQGATDVERAVLSYLHDVAGMAPEASGILTGGTSQATILALTTARARLFGTDIRRTGLAGLPPVRVYIAEGGHSCVAKALEIMGHGSDSLTRIPPTADQRMDPAALQRAITADRARGITPLAIVGTAGSVGIGAFDDLDALADIARHLSIWLHVDAAFGFWIRLAEAPWRDLARGLHRADSIALDLHKWIGVPYACGACLIADAAAHRAAFTARPDYLASAAEGLAGGDHWFCDYGMDLSRGFAALKAWAAIATHGSAAFSRAITDNCRQAALMGELARTTPGMDLATPVISNVCCIFTPGHDPAALAARLQLDGTAVFSTGTVDGRPCLRAAIVNHRTTGDDIHAAIAALSALLA